MMQKLSLGKLKNGIVRSKLNSKLSFALAQRSISAFKRSAWTSRTLRMLLQNPSGGCGNFRGFLVHDISWNGTYQGFSSKIQISASDKSRISALDSTIETAAGELEEICSRTKGIEDEIRTLEKKILDIGGARLLTQKSKVDGLKLHINLANDEITKAEVAKAKAEKDVAKLRKNIQNNTNALSEAEADLEELDREMAECAQAVRDIKDNVEDARAKEENSKADLDEVKSRLDELSEKIRGFKKQEAS